MDTHAQRTITLQLYKEFDSICWRHKILLKKPLIQLGSWTSFLGRWWAQTRSIELSLPFVTQAPWDDVIGVFKHEIAHQIVSEVYKSSDTNHGEKFQMACAQIGVPQRFRNAQTEASPEIPKEQLQNTSLLQRVQKLLALAQSTNEHESSMALQKARELYSKHHLQLHQTAPNDFSCLVVSTGRQKLSQLHKQICSLLIEHYNVEIIIADEFDIKTLKKLQTIELFGRKEIVPVAEYVYSYLWYCLENLWNQYKKIHSTKNTHKTSYMLGVLHGFSEKLAQQKKELQKHIVNPSDQKSLLILESNYKNNLKNWIQERHPRLRHRKTQSSGIHSESYGQGISAGYDLQIHSGLKKGQPIKTSLLKGFL